MQEFLLAYLDPGTGSMLWQVIIASFMGLVIVFGIMKNKILSLFGRSRPPLDEADSSSSEIPPQPEPRDEQK